MRKYPAVSLDRTSRLTAIGVNLLNTYADYVRRASGFVPLRPKAN